MNNRKKIAELMPLPSRSEIRLVLLQLIGDGELRSLTDCANVLAGQFRLSNEERHQLKPWGNGLYFFYRCECAAYDLIAAGLATRTRAGFLRVSDLGSQILLINPPALDNRYLLQFPGYAAHFEKKSEH